MQEPPTPERSHHPGMKQKRPLGNEEILSPRCVPLSMQQVVPPSGFVVRGWWHRILCEVTIIDFITLSGLF